MSHREAPPLPDALVHHQLTKEARGASRGQFGRRGAPPASHHARHLRGLQLQVHVLLEGPDARVHLDAQLVGRHTCRRGSSPLWQTTDPLRNSEKISPSPAQQASHVKQSFFDRNRSFFFYYVGMLQEKSGNLLQTFSQEKASIPFCCLCGFASVHPCSPCTSLFTGLGISQPAVVPSGALFVDSCLPADLLLIWGF